MGKRLKNVKDETQTSCVYVKTIFSVTITVVITAWKKCRTIMMFIDPFGVP